MKVKSFAALAGMAALLAFGLGANAQAQSAYWSVGVSSPGVQLDVSSAPPVLVLPPGFQPVYVQPRPVYVVPPRVVYLRPAPVVRQPVPQYIRADWRYAGHRHGREERRERWEGQHPDRGEHDRRS